MNHKETRTLIVAVTSFLIIGTFVYLYAHPAPQLPDGQPLYKPNPAVEALPWTQDLTAAMALAEESGKPILANFTGSDWCIACVYMGDEVFATPQFAEWAEDNAVLMKVDFPESFQLPEEIERQNTLMLEQLGIQSFPTIVFFEHTGRVIGALGYMPGGPENWITQAEQILSKRVAQAVDIE